MSERKNVTTQQRIVKGLRSLADQIEVRADQIRAMGGLRRFWENVKAVFGPHHVSYRDLALIMVAALVLAGVFAVIFQ